MNHSHVRSGPRKKMSGSQLSRGRLFPGEMNRETIVLTRLNSLHRLHLVRAGSLSKSGFQSSASVSNLSANQRQKLLNFPLLTNEMLEQHVKSICSIRSTIAGPGSCSKDNTRQGWG